MRFMAIPLDNDPVINAERERLRPWCATNGYEYVEYNGLDDLLSKMSAVLQARPGPIEILEIDAHGNPSTCNNVTSGNASTFGRRLSRLSGFSGNSVVYLSGCNTGLTDQGVCVSQLLASAAGCTVYGSRGYLSGTHAEGNQQVWATVTIDGIVYPPYPGAVDATGSACWQAFRGVRFVPAGATEERETPMLITLQRSDSIAHLLDEQAASVYNLIKQTVSSPGKDSPGLRIAPDATITVHLPDGDKTYDLLARGAVLRERESNKVWQLQNGDRLMSYFTS